MKLNVMERIILLNLLPKEGNFKTLKLLRVLKENLAFSEEENKLLNFRTQGDTVEWDNTVGEQEIPIGETMHDILSEILKKLDKEEKLTDQHISLYDKFIIQEN